MLLAVEGPAVADDVFHQYTVVGQQLPPDLFYRSPEIDVAFKDAVDLMAFLGPRRFLSDQLLDIAHRAP